MTTLLKKLLPLPLLALAAFPGASIGQEAVDDDVPALSTRPSLENGDLDGNGTRNVTDVIRILNYLFQGGPPPMPAFCLTRGASGQETENVPTTVRNGDLDGNGSINITDVILLVNWLFLGGEAPVPLLCDSVSSA